MRDRVVMNQKVLCKKRGYSRLGVMLVMAFVVLMTCGMRVQAAEYAVAPFAAYMYTGEGAELFAEPDPLTLAAVFPGDLPIQITGITSNGYYQILVNGLIYYMHGSALSTKTGTTAYKLTSIDAKAALVADLATGEIIYQQNMLDRLVPASTTKVMTTLLVLEAISQGNIALDTPVVVSSTALAGVPSDASHVNPRLKAGEVLNVLSLLEAVMIKSDCHACNVLAELVAGSVDNFVALMNMKAAALGCVDTNFVNTSGYPANNHYTNAYSLSLIMREALKYQTFQTIIGLKTVEIPATNLSKVRKLENTNALILSGDYYNPYVIGGKTGYCKASKNCLVTAAIKDGEGLITVILGAQTNTMTDGTVVKQQFSETNKLIEIGFATLAAS
ncbi:MAG: D-alanyl-D-alanine carboxypeptidase [Lachnospiraceae bacterium]|nr:D-alanyl-D-alanine carboxypeptidase [Lachnospiraceae bacterium]